MNTRELLLGLAEKAGRAPLEAEFLRAIADDPDDEATRAAYADWLEENGREQMALYLRLDVERARTHRTAERFAELAKEMEALETVLDQGWRSGLQRPGRVLNCGGAGTSKPRVRFTFRCPNRWSDLTGPSGASVRYCGDCRRHVFLCESAAEAEHHARKGDCIAINSRVALDVIADPQNEPPDMFMTLGEVALEGEEEPEPLDTEELADMGITPESIWAERLFPDLPPKPWWQFW
jgi:uncharacterized protein (TIGR02996 family)